jgi:adenylate cyclase
MKNLKVRQLAAVMFTDIVGYTALMQGDEQVAASARAHHREVFEAQHKLHQGEIVQYYGDGTLSVFKSAIEAAQCATEIQKLLGKDEPVPVRIGLHLGDIVFDKTEVYGDGVNFASRIESMGIAGAILLSGKLNDELKNHPTISTASMGHYVLKNIANPVEVFAITNQGITVPKPEELKGKQKAVDKTIAVLPFVNMSTSSENEYFSDGITEEIINALAKIQELKVTSRTSAFFFKGKNIPITEIGEQLKVSTILEGSVRLSGKSMRITAQLIDAEEDFHFWSETWDREINDVFQVQDEISLLIAEKLREQFGHLEIQERLVEKQTDSIDAYEYSLKASFHKNKWNPEDVQKAISLYEKALELDPNHTRSLVGLGDAQSFMATCGYISFEEGWGKAAILANQAIQLNDQLPDAYYLLANLAFFTECDYRKSFELTAKAISLNPNYVEAQQFMSFLYILAGQKEKARKHLDIALTVDPLSQETQFYSGYLDYMLEDYSKSIKQLDKCLEVNPKNIPALSVKSICLVMLGRTSEVIPFFDAMPSEIVIIGEKTGAIALSYAVGKDKENIGKYRSLLLEQASAPDGFTASSYLFLLYSVLGETENAFKWVADAIETRSPLLLLRFADPLVNPIKDDPRYQAFHKELFPEDLFKHRKSKSLKTKALLDEEASATYKVRLLEKIENDEPYLNPDLTLRLLAAQVSIHPNQLSWLLNDGFGKNFNEFINHYRIEAFKKLAKNPENSNITVMGLAYDSGFNSKTVFNTYFKKETGLTPKQFLKG